MRKSSKIEEVAPDQKQLHRNIPQLLNFLVQAAVTLLVWGRATGKTSVPGAEFTLRNAMLMPRSNGGILSTSYEKLLTTVVPALIEGWENFGYKENKHYWVRKNPPDKLSHLPKAYRRPESVKHYITWYNGSGQFLISLDRPGLSNGLSIDYLFGDEARFFKRDRFQDVLMTIRGNADKFGDLSAHGSILLTTDMPNSSKGDWLFEYEKDMEADVVELILKIQYKLFLLQEEMQGCSEKKRKKLQREVNDFEASLNVLRTNLVFYHEASTLENIHALGLNTLIKFKRILSDLEFQTSVLSRRVKEVANGFYSGFDEDKHEYEATDYDYIDSIEQVSWKKVEKNCLWDRDIDLRAPLEIACDYNNSINCVVVGQDGYDGFATRNALYVENPLFLADLVKKFCDYYEPHRTKEVTYYYDHTAIATNATSDISYADQWITILEERGWTVSAVYIGQAPSHHSRYLFWQLLFAGDNRLPPYRQNKTNCEQLKISMQQCGSRKATNGETKKIKTTETDPNYPQKDAPHLSEANDTLWYYKFKKELDDMPTTPPMAAVS